jgi:GntR family transcriptional regulator/MocR family aminotransferase
MLSEFLLTHMAALQRTAGADASAPLPLNRQLYEALRRAMLDGKLGSAERLPSSRDLAQDLGLSRNTVMAAISQLTVEGYLTSQVGSGTFVADSVPAVRLGQAPGRATRRTATMASRSLSKRGDALAHSFNASELEVQPFAPGAADFSAFPVALWQRLQNKHWRHTRPDMLDYNDCGGHGPLRRAVADYLRVFRSVQLEPDQVIITSGTQQSLELCAQLLADHGDTVWVEDPAYWGAVKAFMATGLEMHPVAVDDEGIAPQDADHRRPPRLVYVTPSHQYPTGAVMSLARRQALLQAARQHNAWVLEDDYDSEFRFSGPPVSSLQGLDADGRVLYMGTFSKVLYPGLKLGYLVVPKALVAAFKQAHYDLNRPGQMPLQAALAEFIEMGHFASALRKARQAYAERRRALVAALHPCLGPAAATPATRCWVGGAEQGLHLCVRLPAGTDDRALALQAQKHNLIVRPLSAYCIARTDLRGLVIGYGYAPLDAIRRHSPALVQLLMQVRP